MTARKPAPDVPADDGPTVGPEVADGGEPAGDVPAVEEPTVGPELRGPVDRG